MTFTFEPIPALGFLISAKNSTYTPPEIKQELEELDALKAKYTNSSPAQDWLNVYQRAFGAATALHEHLQAVCAPAGGREAAAKAEEAKPKGPEDLMVLEANIKSTINALKAKATGVQYDLDAEMVEVEPESRKLAESIVIPEQRTGDAIRLSFSGPEKSQALSRFNRRIQGSVMTKANALNQFVQKEKGPLIASIQQESQKWGMGDASGLGHPFHFKAKPLDVPDFTREIELPRLLEVFFQSLRTGLMTVLSLGTTLFSVAMGVYYMFLKGQGAAVTSQTMTMRYKFYAVLAIIAIPLITGFTLRWGRKQRDKKAAKEVEVARKQIKQEIGREIQNAYKRCLDAFKKALSKHAYETETRFGEVLGAMSLYKQQQRKAGPVATFGVASPLAGMSLQGADKFIERLEKSLLPALKERITLLSVKVREEPLQIGFDLRMWLCTKDTGEEAVSVLEQDVKTYEFPVGQEIHLYLKSDKTVHLLVLNYDQSGQCQLVFPNSHHPNDRLIGHVPHIIPGNGQRYPFRWRVVAAGENRFRAIATTQASLLPADQNTPAAFHELDDNELRNLLDRLEDELQKIPPEMHRVVEIRYRVTM